MGGALGQPWEQVLGRGSTPRTHLQDPEVEEAAAFLHNGGPHSAGLTLLCPKGGDGQLARHLGTLRSQGSPRPSTSR